jgi:hypothetical protein
LLEVLADRWPEQPITVSADAAQAETEAASGRAMLSNST